MRQDRPALITGSTSRTVAPDTSGLQTGKEIMRPFSPRAPRQRTLNDLNQVLARTRPFLIVAPPRSASTALARCLLNHSRIGPYVHEPCDLYRHHQAPVASILERIEEVSPNGASLLIKEMTFQMGTGPVSDSFLRNGREPVVFLIRDPRLCIESRIRRVLADIQKQTASNGRRERIEQALEARDYRELDDVLAEDVFPLAYTGWGALARQLRSCGQAGYAYTVVTATEFRSRPRACLKRLCSRWNLAFEETMLNWKGDELTLGALSDQSRWYRRVLGSSGVTPEASSKLPARRFPGRFRSHLKEACGIYREARNDSG